MILKKISKSECNEETLDRNSSPQISNQLLVEDISSVRHNITYFKDIVVREDNIILETKGRKRDFCPGCLQKYSFNNPPHILNCCHRLCRECISDSYSNEGEKVALK
jgi:hypothetical protein